MELSFSYAYLNLIIAKDFMNGDFSSQRSLCFVAVNIKGAECGNCMYLDNFYSITSLYFKFETFLT